MEAFFMEVSFERKSKKFKKRIIFIYENNKSASQHSVMGKKHDVIFLWGFKKPMIK